MKFVRAAMILMLVTGLGSALWSFLGHGLRPVSVPPLQVEVLNGCGEPGLAQRAAERLQALGHEVLIVADAGGEPRARSLVLDRRGRQRISEGFAAGIGPCPVLLERREPAGVDLTLILGADWKQLLLFRTVNPVSGL